MPRFKDMNRSIPGLRSHVLGDGDMKIDGRMPHLKGGRTFVDWDGAVSRFHEVGLALGLVAR